MLTNTLVSLAVLVPASLAWELQGRQVDGPTYINYTTVTGYFLQDEAVTDPTSFDYTQTNFGLLNRAYDTDAAFDPKGEKTQWARFANKVKHLNAKACPNTQYKVLLMQRHGEGWHNAAESFYGTPAWNCYWGLLDGNGTAIWNDPLLTRAGEAESIKAHNFWRTQISEQKQPAPESFYTSPLARCTTTVNTTFNGLGLDNFFPIVKEYLREGISIRTCDHRNSKTYIANMFPWYRFEAGFAELDPLFNGVDYETSEAQAKRNKVLLDELFTTDKNTWLSLTAHSGEIGSLLGVLKHRPFRLATGQAIPVLVKAVTFRKPENFPPTSTIVSWTQPSTCTALPVQSMNGKCVCPTATTGLASSAIATVTAVP